MKLEKSSLGRTMKVAMLASTSMSALSLYGFHHWKKNSRGPLPAPLASILQDIQKALDAKLYYPALIVTLTLPEICAGMTLTPSENTVKKEHYIKFVETYAPNIDNALGLSGDECFQLRCGMVHRGGSAMHPQNNLTHYIFTIPESEQKLHGATLEVGEWVAKTLDLIAFTEVMIGAVYEWFEKNRNNQAVHQAASEVLSVRPEGLPPFIIGKPLLASGPILFSFDGGTSLIKFGD